jgi:hypothetical protein
MALVALPVDERPADVEPVLVFAHRNLERPSRGRGVAGDEVDGLGPAREADVDVLLEALVRSRSAAPAGKIAPEDLHDHARHPPTQGRVRQAEQGGARCATRPLLVRRSRRSREAPGQRAAGE